MGMAETVAAIALQVSRATGVGYVAATAVWPGTPVMVGGSIVTPGTPVEKSCQAQIDRADEAMRAEAGFTERDMRVLILLATLDGELDTDARLIVSAGPHAGTWSLQSVGKDAAGTHWRCRGRRDG